MNKYVLLTALALVLAAPSSARAGERLDQMKSDWKAHWQQQTGEPAEEEGGPDIAQYRNELQGEQRDYKKELMDKYGKLSEQEREALKERVQAFREEHPGDGKSIFDANDRTAKWEMWRQEHPDIAQKLGKTEEERREKWAEWKQAHENGGGSIVGQKAEALKDKWQELKDSQNSTSDWGRHKGLQDFEFHNRDEALELKNKYENWRASHPSLKQGLDEKIHRLEGH